MMKSLRIWDFCLKLPGAGIINREISSMGWDLNPCIPLNIIRNILYPQTSPVKNFRIGRLTLLRTCLKMTIIHKRKVQTPLIT